MKLQRAKRVIATRIRDAEKVIFSGSYKGHTVHSPPKHQSLPVCFTRVYMACHPFMKVVIAAKLFLIE